MVQTKITISTNNSSKPKFIRTQNEAYKIIFLNTFMYKITIQTYTEPLDQYLHDFIINIQNTQTQNENMKMQTDLSHDNYDLGLNLRRVVII